MTPHMHISRIWGTSLAIACLVFVGVASPTWAEPAGSVDTPEGTAGIGDGEWQLELEKQYADERSYQDGGENSPRPSGNPEDTPSTTEDAAYTEIPYDLQNTCFDVETMEFNMMCSNIYWLNKPCENQGIYEDVEDITVRCAPDWAIDDNPSVEEDNDEPSPAAVAESVFMSMSPRLRG